MAIFNVPSAKMVKAIEKNILWTSCRHHGAMVHYVTMYITPQSTSEANEQLRNLRWILSRIRHIDRERYNAVVVGDLNKIAIGKV